MVDDPVALLSCWNWVVGKSSENKEAAYKFLQYAASEEGQTDYAHTFLIEFVQI